MDRINLLFVLPNFDTGGSEKLVVDLIQNLDSKVFNPVLTVFFTGTYEETFKRMGYPFYVIHNGRVRSKVETLTFLKRIVERHGIQLVNTHHTSPLIQGFLPFKVLGRKILIHTEHSRLDQDRRIHKKAILMERLLLKGVDRVVGVSHEVCRYMVDTLGVRSSKVCLIPNGVDIKRFHIPDFDRRAYRKRLGIREDVFLIGLFANFRPEKNHILLIRALSTAIKRGQQKVHLLFCGTGDMEGYLKEEVKRLNLGRHVSFLGYRFDIPELMNTLDLYCLPSRFEGMPFSLLEAMAAGVPVVATDVSGTREIIKEGETGLLVPAEDPEALAGAILHLMEDGDLREGIARRGLKEVERYSFDRTVKAYEALFTGALEGGGYGIH